MPWLRSRRGSLALLPALLWALLACAHPAAAQEEPPAETVEAARFLIETITVETDREASAGIIESETLLEEGETYTEDDLRQAVARVHRLPFVLGADFSLRKGSERGAYELVIRAYTARWFFYDRRVRISRFDEAFALGGAYSNREGYATSQTGVIGGRLFVGRSGMLYGSLGFHEDLVSDDSGIHLGYTQYDLFGRGIVASLTYGVCCDSEVLPFGIDPNLTTWQWNDSEQYGLSLSIPLSANRSIQAGWTETRGTASNRRSVLDPFGSLSNFGVAEGDQSSRRLEARWVHDTSDDPVLPSRGTVLSAGLEYARYEAGVLRAVRFSRDQPPVDIELPSFDGEQLAAVVGATRHWSLTPRQSVSAGGRISAGRSQIRNLPAGGRFLPETDLNVYGGSVDAGHLLRLWSLREPGNPQDVYIETTATYGIESASQDLGVRHNPLERLNLSTGLTYRTRWGRLRFLLTFLDLGEVLG